MDTILSNVYQEADFFAFRSAKITGFKWGKTACCIFYRIYTGVGKTTTIAKIASKYKVDYEKKVAFITADTYRIAATEQLQVYANILDAPMSIVYSKEELNEAIGNMRNTILFSLILLDFPIKMRNRKRYQSLIQGVDPEYTKWGYILVLSATTKYRDLLDIVDTYHTISEFMILQNWMDINVWKFAQY